MKKNKVAIILGIVCFIVTIAIFIQIRTIENSSKDIGITITAKSSLRDELLQVQGEYQTLYNKLEKLEKKLETSRTKATSNNSSNKDKQEQLSNNQKLLGLTKVTGDGITITVDDNREISVNGDVINASDYIVHEQDLIQIINELFNAGADAVSINGNRIVSTSSILCDGVILRINGEMTGVPLTIKAIGYPERLYYALIRPQGYLDIMKQDGVIVEVEKTKNLQIPKYDGIYNDDYIN